MTNEINEEQPISRILIVEPDELLASEMSNEIQSFGYEVKSVANHFKGLTEMEDENFDFVLASMENTGIDGLEFCKICKQRASKGRIICPYIILIGEEWHLVSICESDTPADDYIIRPYLGCELKWRLKSGRSFLDIQGKLRKMLDIEPLTGLKNQRGIQTALREEINRQGRKNALLGVAVLALDKFEILELTKGKFWSEWAQQAIQRYLVQILRNYDHMGKLNSGNLCILSAENSLEGMEALIHRLEDKAQEMQKEDAYFSQEIIDIKFRGVFLSLRIETRPGGMKNAVDRLWTWIEKNDSRLPSELTGYRARYSDAGLDISEY
ncbi:MAG: diguanylate cyclase domain-containing protein [Thermodesulfobacteriota bacterium]